MSVAPLSHWDNVTVDSAGRVIDLFLNENKLTGRVITILNFIFSVLFEVYLLTI